MRLLICGDRRWSDLDLIRQTLAALATEFCIDLVIEGEARGADKQGKVAAKELNIPVMECPADWELLGKSAGPIRNRFMLREGKPDLVVAFHDDLDNSKGTKDMVAIAKKAGVAVRIIKHQIMQPNVPKLN
jgi:hypothetical protein